MKEIQLALVKHNELLGNFQKIVFVIFSSFG